MRCDKCTLPSNVELGQLAFSPNTIQSFDCPDWVVALLDSLDSELQRVMWNIHQEEYDSPFANSGNDFVGNNFEVHAYNWNEEENQPFNFKYKNIEISWYKYLGRGTTINGQYTPEELIEMYDNCLKEIISMDKED